MISKILMSQNFCQIMLVIWYHNQNFIFHNSCLLQYTKHLNVLFIAENDIKYKNDMFSIV